jgi:hypothetical protein
MGKKIIVFIITGIWLVGFAFSQSGQINSISGIVKTPEGDSLPGVIVLLKSPSLFLPEVEDITNAAGMYRFQDLSPGIYEVTFILSGFQTIVKKGVVVSTGMTVSVDVDHTLRATDETVIVEGKEPVKKHLLLSLLKNVLPRIFQLGAKIDL